MSRRCRGKSVMMFRPFGLRDWRRRRPGSPSYAVEQPPREMRREARVEDLPRRLVRVVRHAVVLDHLRRVVPDPETGTGIVVARLAAASDAAQVLVSVLDADLLLPDVADVGPEKECALQVGVTDEGEVGQL